MPTLFSRIIDGEIPGVFVWRDPQCVVFLSINPMHPGHTLVVPRAEVDHWIDLEPDVAATCSGWRRRSARRRWPRCRPGASA